MPELYLNKADRLMTYANHRVCAIIDDRSSAGQALDALVKNGSREEDIEILYGREGIDLLHPKGTGHGFFSKMAKNFSIFGQLGYLLVRRYESALMHGGYVFIVPAYTESDKEKVRRSLGSGKAREINSFGKWYIESL